MGGRRNPAAPHPEKIIPEANPRLVHHSESCTVDMESARLIELGG